MRYSLARYPHDVDLKGSIAHLRNAQRLLEGVVPDTDL